MERSRLCCLATVALGLAASALAIGCSLQPTGRVAATPAATAIPVSSTPEGTLSEFSLAHERLSWRTSDGQEKSIEMQSLEQAYPDALPAMRYHRFLRAEISPTGHFIGALVVAFAFPEGGAGEAWHLALISAEGRILGLHSAPDYPCYIHDYAWRPDEQGMVVEIAGGGWRSAEQPTVDCRRLALLGVDGQTVFDVETRGLKGMLFISPDSQWAGLDDGPAAGEKRRVELIWLADPKARLDLPISVLDELDGWTRSSHQYILSP